MGKAEKTELRPNQELIPGLHHSHIGEFRRDMQLTGILYQS